MGKSSISMGHLYHGYVSHNQRVFHPRTTAKQTHSEHQRRRSLCVAALAVFRRSSRSSKVAEWGVEEPMESWILVELWVVFACLILFAHSIAKFESMECYMFCWSELSLITSGGALPSSSHLTVGDGDSIMFETGTVLLLLIASYFLSLWITLE